MKALGQNIDTRPLIKKVSTLGQKERQHGITYHLPDCNTIVRICVIHRIKGLETRLGKYDVSKHLGNPPLKACYQGGRTKPLKYTTEDPILLGVGLGHPIMSQRISKRFGN
jgi:hypothetical protein